jgi:hypothetical protein
LTLPVSRFHLTIFIPARLARIFNAFVLLYRRLRFGCAYCRIELTQGKFALVDPDDFNWLNNYNWHAIKKGNNFYASRFETINGRRRHIYMHRQIMQSKLNPVPCTLNPDLVIDHIDRNSLNNCKSNLRLATRTQNNWNSARGKNQGRSKYKGISWKPAKRKWQATLYINGRAKSLGYYSDEISAARAFDAAAKKHRRQYACLNFE